MALYDPQIEHLLRRAGFGGADFELSYCSSLGAAATVNLLVDYQDLPDEVDAWLGSPAHAGVLRSNGEFAPNTNIDDARVRWLFRMLHGYRPLQEKMALFWHNHFATGYSKVAGALGSSEATRYLAAKPSEDPAGVRGQVEAFRQLGLGNFRDLLLVVATDIAMLVWLDGRRNFRAKPQENFGRELMELFTIGVGVHTESDVRAAARVFTGWNMQRAGEGQPYRFFYDPRQHDTASKTFSFQIYPGGGATIPARPADIGYQDGLDLITALALHPATAVRLARKLYQFFICDTREPDEGFVQELAGVYMASGGEIRPVVRHLLNSGRFWDAANRFARYAWPTEFVIRTIKETGWTGFSLRTALSPMAAMGQTLFEPPNVGGWITGRGWFGASAMLARMNFVRDLARSQRTALAIAAGPAAASPDSLVGYMLARFPTIEMPPAVRQELLDYARAGGPWNETAILAKAPAVARLICSAPQYQFM